METEDVIWERAVEGGVYNGRVVRRWSNRGQLVVIRTTDSAVILDTPVTVSNDAVNGPDPDDVMVWENMALNAIHNYLP